MSRQEQPDPFQIPPMRALLGTLAALTAVAYVAGADATRTFDDDPVASRPPGFTFAATRQAVSDQWIVERDGSNRFLTHPRDASGRPGYALAVLDDAESKDLAIAVRLKFTGGNREGGLIWRYQDASNFYSARLDLLDQRMAIDRVVRGNRIRIEGEDDLELDVTAWHVLRVRHEKDRIRVYLGGVKVFDTIDRTFREPGGVGLFASGESAISFDDFRVEDR